MAQSVTLKQYEVDGIYRGAFVPTPDEILFPEGYFQPARSPFQIECPVTVSATPQVMHHRVAYPGMPWEYPIVPSGGSWPYAARTESNIASIGQNLVLNAFGDYVPDSDFLVTKIESPQAGPIEFSHQIFSQDSQIAVHFDLDCSTENHFFTSPTQLGTGSGNSPENARAWADTYLGATTIGPARGKVLVMMPGNYTGSTYELNPAFNATNVIGYPGEDDAILGFTFIVLTNDYFVGMNIRFKDIDLVKASCVKIDGNRSRGVFHKLKAENLTQDGTPNNQSFFFFNSPSSGHRENIVVSQCEAINCTTHFIESYSIASGHFYKNKVTITNPAITSVRNQFYPKINNRFVQISFCEMNAPLTSCKFITFGGEANLATGSCLGVAQYNYCHLNGSTDAVAIETNLEAGNDNADVPSIVYLERNSFVNARMYFRGPVAATEGTHTYANNNAVQNIDGGELKTSSGVPIGDYTQSGIELYGVSGIFDADDRIVNVPLRGQRSAQVWRP